MTFEQVGPALREASILVSVVNLSDEEKKKVLELTDSLLIILKAKRPKKPN
jgi:hypothetical protein